MYGSVGSLSAGSSSPVSSASCSPTGLSMGPGGGGSFGCRSREQSGGSTSSSSSSSSMGVLGLAAHEGQLPSGNPWAWTSSSSNNNNNNISGFINQHQQQHQQSSTPGSATNPLTYHQPHHSHHHHHQQQQQQQQTTTPPPATQPSSGGPPSPTTATNSNQIAQELVRLFMNPGSASLATPASSHVGLGCLPLGSLSSLANQLPHPFTDIPPPTRGNSWDEFNSNGRESELDELDRLLRGLEVRDSRAVVMNLPDYLPGDRDQEILTKSRLLEILKERERQRSARKRGLLKTAKQGKVCVFCRNNGEAEAVYTSHQLKDSDGKITCPVLYIYTCPICGANGPQAHTIKYCPLNPGDTPNIRSLKTARTSAGRRRNLP